MQAANSGQEDVEYTGLAWYEITLGPIDLQSSWELCPAILGALVIDAKSVGLVREARILALGMLDKRAAIEALALRQALRWSRITLRWVHSQAQ